MDAAILSQELPDTEDWKPEDCQTALWQYFYMLELMAGPLQNSDHAAAEAWSNEIESINDILFLRDEIEAAGSYHGWHWFDRTDDTPELELLDARLRKLYTDSGAARQFIVREYNSFRHTMQPDEDAWWWRLDCA